MTYYERHRIGTFDTGGRFTPLLDVNDGVNIRVREFKVVPSEKQPVYPGATRRYGGSRKAGETHGNGSLAVSWILRDSTADEVLGQWDALAELLESTRADLFYEWRPGEATRSTYFELRGGLPADWDYVWWQFNREILQLSAGFVIAPLAFGDPMDVLDGFGSDTLSDYTFDASASTDVAVAGGVLTPVASAPAFSPLDLSPEMWYEADALALADGAAVSSWTDSSGNARHATQATGASQPTYQTNELNGEPIVRFDGTDLLATASLAPPTSQTFFAVVKVTVSAGFPVLSAWGAGQFEMRMDSAKPTWVIGGSTAADAASRLNTWIVLVGRADNPGNAMEVWVNGTSVATASGNGSPGAAAMTIGARPDGSLGITADVAEVIRYGTALSAANREAVEDYLGAKYGITIA